MKPTPQDFRPQYSLAAVFGVLLMSVSLSRAATSTTQPREIVDSPTLSMHRYLRALDAGDRKAALNSWNTTDSRQAKLSELQVDMMLAVSKLKKAAAKHISDVAPFDLNMAVVGEGECKAITEVVKDRTATIEVTSVDDQQAKGEFSMVMIDGFWKLTAANQMKDQPTNVPFEATLAAGKAMIKIVNSATDGVNNGRLHSADDVKRSISESLPE